MNCPGSEQAAAYTDGRIDAAESARYLEHCADCDECRRTLAILFQSKGESTVPEAMEARAISALRRSLERERTPRAFRRTSARNPQPSPSGLLIAAALLVGFVGLVLTAKQPPVRVPDYRELAQRASVPEPPIAPGSKPAPVPDAPPDDAVPKLVSDDVRRIASPK
ncbi:MAG TPA: hypothetical protein VKW04_16380, partial [Planctomycetota bacterium]|nr:hypothetical protein [Planctomycetota bacterium]